MEATMRRLLLVAAMVVTVVIGMTTETQAKANDAAPCIGENASTFAPALRGDFGQGIVAPEAQAGLTGETASTNARDDCN
jgi:hypothetical protein